MRIILFEDDQIFADLFRMRMSPAMEVVHYVSATGLKDKLARIESFDAVLFDLNMSHEFEGLDCVQEYYRLGYQQPCFILTSDERVSTKLKSLEARVDDYLAKSMTVEELQLRLKNRILKIQEQKVLTYGNLLLFLDSFECVLSLDRGVRNAEPISLSKIEFLFAKKLLTSVQPVNKEILTREVWRQQVVDDGTLNTLVWALNKKLQGWSCKFTYSQIDGVRIVERKK
jgi:DNA-binding response OmpR family regulator